MKHSVPYHILKYLILLLVIIILIILLQSYQIKKEYFNNDDGEDNNQSLESSQQQFEATDTGEGDAQRATDGANQYESHTATYSQHTDSVYEAKPCACDCLALEQRYQKICEPFANDLATCEAKIRDFPRDCQLQKDRQNTDEKKMQTVINDLVEKARIEAARARELTNLCEQQNKILQQQNALLDKENIEMRNLVNELESLKNNSKTRLATCQTTSGLIGNTFNTYENHVNASMQNYAYIHDLYPTISNDMRPFNEDLHECIRYHKYAYPILLAEKIRLAMLAAIANQQNARSVPS